MEKSTKQHLLVVVVGVCLFAALMNLSAVLECAGKIIDLVIPIIVGGIIALFINVPTNGIKKQLKKLTGKMKKEPSDSLLHIISFVITIICIIVVLVVTLTMLIPELIKSTQSVYYQIQENIPGWIAYLDAHNINGRWIEDLLAGFNIDQITNSITAAMDVLVGNVLTALSSTVNIVVTASFAIIISIYMVIGNDWVGRHAKKIIYAYLRPSASNFVLKFCRMFYQSFANFLSGQCSEAIILGILMFLAFTVFGLPYAILVALLTTVCAIIPYIGAFLSCFVSIFLTMIYDPSLAIKCAVVYLVVQFIENQFIYPRVVGKSVGMPAFYTLVAAMIGGQMFGIIGILFFIPLAAVIIELIKEDASRRISQKEQMQPIK